MKFGLRHMSFCVAAFISLGVVGTSIYELVELTNCSPNSEVGATVYSKDIWISLLSSVTSFWIGNMTSRKIFIDKPEDNKEPVGENTV